MVVGSELKFSAYANMSVLLRLLDPDGPPEWAFHQVSMHPRRATPAGRVVQNCSVYRLKTGGVTRPMGKGKAMSEDT